MENLLDCAAACKLIGCYFCCSSGLLLMDVQWIFLSASKVVLCYAGELFWTKNVQVPTKPFLLLRLLAHSTEILAQCLTMSLQVQAVDVISKASFEMIECFAQCDPQTAAAHLALYQVGTGVYYFTTLTQFSIDWCRQYKLSFCWVQLLWESGAVRLPMVMVPTTGVASLSVQTRLGRLFFQASLTRTTPKSMACACQRMKVWVAV